MTEDEIVAASRRLVTVAELLGIALSDRQVRQFQTYCSTLLEANQRFNLTGLKTPANVMRTLFLDSLTISSALPIAMKESSRRVRVVDVGTGAGIPGLPLKILFPHWSMVLVESAQKKAKFVQEVADALQLPDVTVVNARAEEVGTMRQYRDRADLCLARAVSALPTLVELCAPLVKVGGVMVFPKSGNLARERDSAAAAACSLKVRMERMERVPDHVGLGDDRFIIVYKKMNATPPGYPRRIGLAKSRPIGSAAAAGPSPPRAPQLPEKSSRRRPLASE